MTSGEVPQNPRDIGSIGNFIDDFTRIKDAFSSLSPSEQRNKEYRCQASYILGLVTAPGIKKARLTTTGRVFAAMPALEKRRRLSFAFEGSRVGRAWLVWAGARDLSRLRGQDAEDFLRATSVGLSDDTLEMRAGTLREWLGHFMVARNQYETSDHKPARRPHPLAELRPVVFEAESSHRLAHALVQGCSRLDIATGYFTLGGFDLLADGLDDPQIRILVGALDDDRRGAGQAQFLARFVRSLERGLEPPQQVKTDVINQIYWKIIHGKISISTLDAKASARLHAKVFIFDRRAAYVTSANLTTNGLRRNIEGGHLVISGEDIDYYAAKFEEHWGTALPLAEEVLRGIEKSWVFQPPVSPYLAFLRALYLLYGTLREPERVPARTLAEFQTLIVSHVLGKFAERRGVLLVAPTGTGKTVMAAYAAAALWGSKINRVLVVCNNDSLERAWRRELQMMGIDPGVITSGKLRGKSRNPKPSLEDIDHIRKYLRDDTLVIVDECHQYRTPGSNGHDRLRSLLLPEDHETRPYVLMLTATAISRGPENLQALLSLTDYGEVAEIKSVAAAAQEPGLVNVTLPDILRRFGAEDPKTKKRALHFGESLRYYPHIDLELLNYVTPMGAIFSQIEEFAQVLSEFGDLASELAEQLTSGGEEAEDEEFTGNLRRQANLLKTLLARRAESSPQALVRTLERMIDLVDGRNLSTSERRKLITTVEPLLAAARKIMSPDLVDTKLDNLVSLLKKHKRHKILIFSEYIDTADYLYEHLKATFGDLEIGQLTGDTAKAEKRRTILNFAPEAQGGSAAKEIDILIGTDAISEGENLQDARVLINYDLPWTPLRLVQRLGRLDRPTESSRKVHAYNYFPDLQRYRDMISHWVRLDGRSAHVQQMSDAEVLRSTKRDPDEYLGKPRQLYFEAGATYSEILDAVRDQQIPTSSFLQAQMNADPDDQDEARKFPSGIYTARAGVRPGLYLLVEFDGEYQCIAHLQDELGVRSIDRVRFLKTLMSEPDTPLLPLPLNMNQRIADAMGAWSKPRDPSNVEQICLQIAVWVESP